MLNSLQHSGNDSKEYDVRPSHQSAKTLKPDLLFRQSEDPAEPARASEQSKKEDKLSSVASRNKEQPPSNKSRTFSFQND